MNNELLAMLEYIEQERGISKEQVVKALEQAILSAYKKSAHPATDLNVEVNLRTGELKAWARLKVVEEFPWEETEATITPERVLNEMDGFSSEA